MEPKKRNDPLVLAFMAREASDDPILAIRNRVRFFMLQFSSFFPETAPPIDMEALASFRGIKISNEPPQHSDDAELVSGGGLRIRLSRNRPVTRQRFSVGHEIGHTFFEGFSERVQCRKGKDQDWAEAGDILESLCDVAAAEMLMPLPWFRKDAKRLQWTAAGLIELAEKYAASLDATVRRRVDLSNDACAAIFLDWALKPRQKGNYDDRQAWMFGMNPEEEANTVRKLRVRYSVANADFSRRYPNVIPRHKSLVSQVCEDAAQGAAGDGEEWLDFGTMHGRFSLNALPIYTPADARGPNGEWSVVAVTRPVQCPIARLG